MKKTLLEILVCPTCEHDLELHHGSEAGDEIVSGRLCCAKCQRVYNITKGIPCMLPNPWSKDDTREAFTAQWRLRQEGEFERKSQVYGFDIDFRIEYLFKEIPPSLLERGWALDAGCGPGDSTHVAAMKHPHTNIVGMDLNDAIYDIDESKKNAPNLHFVQADIMHPPFKRGSVGFVYSEGALHHTRDTKQAFMALVPLLAERGALTVWICPHFVEASMSVKLAYLSRDVLFLNVGHLLPARTRLALVRMAAPLLVPLSGLSFALDYATARRNADRNGFRYILDRAPKHLRSRPGDFVRSVIFSMYDSVSPRHQHRHRRSEVLSWFAAKGFTDVRTCDYNPGYYSARLK